MVDDDAPSDDRAAPGETTQQSLTFSRRAVLRAAMLGAVGGPAVYYAGQGRTATAKPRAKAKHPSSKHSAASKPVTPSRPEAERAVTFDFNQGWRFGGRYVRGAEKPKHSDAHYARVTLPHTVTPLSWGNWDPSLWEHVWIYRKHFAGSAVRRGRVLLDFDGVLTNATVYLNGVNLGEHEGGYLPFSVELTDELVSGDNVLAVVVDSRWLNVPPEGDSGGASAVDYFQPGGIYRDVNLRVVPEVFIADVFAKPGDVLTPNPTVAVAATIDSAHGPRHRLNLTAELLDGETPIASGTADFTLKKGKKVVRLTIDGIAGIELWSPDTPKLYTVRVTLSGPSLPSQSFEVSTGFREASFQVDGFYLNGERVQLFGLNRHQLFPYTGMAACDRIGLMVWEEAPGWKYVGNAGFQKLFLQNVHDMIVRDRNRPSVIVWGTRIDETVGHVGLYGQARQLAYSLDGSRQTTGAMHTQSTAGWAEDVFAYDDYHSFDGVATLEPPVPGVPYMVSEAVGTLDGAGLYRWIDTSQTLGMQAQMHADVHDIARSEPGYAGVLAWCAIDYASENGGSRTWENLKWPGVVDTFRVPKPGAAFYRSQVDPTVTPVIAPAFVWDFGPLSPAGPGESAMIATNCDRLEVHVGGQLLTVVTPDTETYGALAYPPAVLDLTVDGTSLPDLVIDGYVGTTLATTLQMSSNRSLDTLALDIEDLSITGDGSDATRFTLRCVDAYGNLQPYVGGEVTLWLSGPGVLISDNPFSFDINGGVGGGFIGSLPDQAGLVTLIASHPTLGQAQGSVNVLAPTGSYL